MIASVLRLRRNRFRGHTPRILRFVPDANFAGGDYYDGPAPLTGLALARRIAHTTYRSPAELEHRFGREENRGESTVGGSLE